MATKTKIVREIIHEGPGASNPVTLEQAGDLQSVSITQDSDRIYMQLEQARAVHAALGTLISEMDAA